MTTNRKADQDAYETERLWPATVDQHIQLDVLLAPRTAWRPGEGFNRAQAEDLLDRLKRAG